MKSEKFATAKDEGCCIGPTRGIHRAQLKDWQSYYSRPSQGRVGDGALILPGGESTVQMRLLKELGLYEPIREAILGGMPVLGTCAGMILLSEGRLGTMDIEVRRNAYGRQLGSFHTVP